MTTQPHALISSARNHHGGDCTLDHATLAPQCPTPWSVTMTRLHGGKQQGVDLITIDNGHMRIRVCPTRGMGIIDAAMGDLRLGWDSPVKEIIHPAFIDLQRRGGTAWLEGFNELLVRCGLEFMGPPCEDTHHLAPDEPPATQITLHGKIANTPASEVEVEVQTQAPYAITLRGVVHERAMFGPKLELSAELTIVPGENTFTVRDTIRNRGGQPTQMCLLYHINQGRPILEDGARLVAPIAKSTPRDAYPPEQVEHVDRYGPPVTGDTEHCYFIDLKPDADGRVTTLLHNKAKDRGLSVAWDKSQLPHFALWKALHDERDCYVTGLEPCTTLPNPRPAERDAGRVVTLAADQAYTAALTFGLHDDASDIARVAKRIG